MRRIEFLKLLRQAPEVTDIAQLDAERPRADRRLAPGDGRVGSGKDRSQEPAFRNARRGKPWFGPVYFRKETEPYMTIAIRSGGDAGPVTVADVNLKFIWDVVSRIKIGDKGKAYVVDGNGFLIADPDIGLVLRKTDLSNLGACEGRNGSQASADELAMLSTDLTGTQVLTSVAPIESLGWKVFVEQPVAEVYQKLNASILRTGLLLLVGLVISALAALALARGMVRPIQHARRRRAAHWRRRPRPENRDPHRRRARGLADQFNRMTGATARVVCGAGAQGRRAHRRTHRVARAADGDQRDPARDLGSPTDVQPVLDAVAERAMKLCDAAQTVIALVEGENMRWVARGSASLPTAVGDVLPISRGVVAGRAIIDRTTIHLEDIALESEDEYPVGREMQRRLGHHTLLAVPLMREDHAIGAIALWRMEARLFSEKQVALVQTFARQAAIAIDNVRLFNETREGLEQQTAISEILRVISSSPTDVAPVLDAIADRALALCDASAASIYLTDGSQLRHLASKGESPEEAAATALLPISRDSISGRAVLEHKTIQVHDVLAEGIRVSAQRRAFAARRPSHRCLSRRSTARASRSERSCCAAGGAAVQRTRTRAAADFRRSGSDRDRECAGYSTRPRRRSTSSSASGEVLAAISNSIADTVARVRKNPRQLRAAVRGQA